MTIPLRSLEKLHAIAGHAIDYRLFDDLIEVRRLCGVGQPVIRIGHDQIRTYQRWMESLRDATVTVGLAQDGFVGMGALPETRLRVSVLMAVRPEPVRDAGLVGEITVADLDVLVGEPVSA